MTPLVGLDDNTTDVLLALIAGVPAWLAAVFAFLTRRQVRTPSGNTIGEVVERTHDLSAANSGLLNRLHGERFDDKDATG